VDNAHLAEHLRFFQALGVTGVSLDARWRRRAAAAPQPSTRAAEDAVAADASPASEDDATPAQAYDQGEAAPVTFARSGEEALEASRRSGEEALEASGRSPEEALQAIRSDIGDCTRCKLHRLGRRQIVFGVGNPSADLMFVGEAPGADEDVQGIPFVGRAGQLLTKIIEAIGLRRDDVYIANVIKCRPPENRNPEPDEVATCEPFLFEQIDRIKPKVIVALGTFAAKALLKTQDPISRLRGRAFDYRGATLIPTFHPAFLLRSPERKRDVWEDMKKVRALLQESAGDED
jgi:DNA polymerase